MELFCPRLCTGFLVPPSSQQLVGSFQKTKENKSILLTPGGPTISVPLPKWNPLRDYGKKLSLLDDEETGDACPKKDAPEKFILAAKFMTKRIVNMESVARTFRPLWRLERDVQIKYMGENILFFNFEDECDIDTVIEHEPWTYK